MISKPTLQDRELWKLTLVAGLVGALAGLVAALFRIALQHADYSEVPRSTNH